MLRQVQALQWCGRFLWKFCMVLGIFMLKIHMLSQTFVIFGNYIDETVFIT